jgi:hypothetical protein
MLTQRLQAGSLLLGPIIFSTSPFFWNDGHYGATGGMLIALSMPFWVYGLLGEYNRLREHIPLVSGLWLFVLLLGMLGSISFGLQGFFEESLGVIDEISLASFSNYPPQSFLLLWLPGPAFPLSLFAFGLMISWTRIAPKWVAIFICIAAIAFPAGRVLRLEWVSYVADLLVVLPFFYLAWHAWHNKERGLWPAGFPEANRNEYDLATIRKWLESFLQRFFEFSQFKRSAIPNGPKVSSSGAQSPRGGWRAQRTWTDEKRLLSVQFFEGERHEACQASGIRLEA